MVTRRSDNVLRLSQAGQGGAQSAVAVTGAYTYSYHMAPADSYWGDELDWDVVDFYNTRFGIGLSRQEHDDLVAFLRGL